MSGLFDFAPNRMGNHFDNRGMESITSNRGHGVSMVRPKPLFTEDTKAKTMNSMRVSAARQFGKKKEQVGF